MGKVPFISTNSKKVWNMYFSSPHWFTQKSDYKILTDSDWRQFLRQSMWYSTDCSFVFETGDFNRKRVSNH
jgi:hypothetical protein